MIILSKNGTPLKTFQKHATSDPLQKFYQSMREGRERLASLPVCPKCERAGFRTKGWKDRKAMHCNHCGYDGPSEYVYSAYVQEQLYR